MKSVDVRNKYLNFFKNNGHVIVPSASLIPQNDPSTLFISSGMQPLLPYFLGEKHPEGDKIVNSQVCLRAHGFMDDLLEVGDNRHTSLFEMLGNWSFGSYFKKEQINYFFQFLTKELNLDPNKLYVSCFIGDTELGVSKDLESVETWKEIFSKNGVSFDVVEFNSMEEAEEKGSKNARICLYPAKKNWWSRNGVPKNMPEGDIGGPDTEVFYEFDISHDEKFGKNCHPNCDCGRFLEIGNSVFTQYQKRNNKFEELPSKNVDFGGGLERLVAVSNNTDDVFETDLYSEIISGLENDLGIKYSENKPLFRIISDHMKSATFLGSYGVLPSNKSQGYVLRKFIRRSAVKIFLFGNKVSGNSQKSDFSVVLSKVPSYVFKIYENVPESYGFGLNMAKLDEISEMIKTECESFKKVLESGYKIIQKAKPEEFNGKFVFNLYQNQGFPFEVSYEILKERGVEISKDEFMLEFEKHRSVSK